MGGTVVTGAPAFDPDFAGAEVCPSPNFGARRGGRLPDALILHYTAMETGEGAQALLCDPDSEVSSHYLVHEDGRIVQMVREADRAWHAGKGSWHGIEDVNSFSIGIEIANQGHAAGLPEFSSAQIAAVIALAGDICRRRQIAPERVLAHSDVAPGRKIDPGERFPWEALARAGVGRFVAAAPACRGARLAPGADGPAVVALQEMLIRCGYGLAATGLYDEATRLVVEAFQRHFRPQAVDGVADVSTCATLRRLLAELPAARPAEPSP